MASVWTWMVATAMFVLAQGAFRTEAVCSTTVGTRVFASCQELQSLGATYAWTFNNATNSVDFAFSGTGMGLFMPHFRFEGLFCELTQWRSFAEAMQAAGGWVGWGINPTGPVMAGTQALVAFENNTGLTVKEYNVTLAQKVSFAPLLPSAISVKYTDISATMTTSSVVTIFGTFALSPGQSATINQVWNRGPSVDLTTFAIAQHSISNLANLQSAGSIDLSTGIATIAGLPHQKLKNVCPSAP